MQKFATLASLLPLVAGHGFVLSPPARQPGDAFAAACGAQAFSQQSSDINGNVQGIYQVIGTDFDAAACNLWLCKGFQFDDAKSADIQSYSPGETIDFTVDIAAPHTGYANVSVVKTSTNSIVGEPLIEFTNYASNNGIPENNTAFSVTLPDNLDGCEAAGDCVLQWFWDAPDIDQTYEACVDFSVGAGSGSGSGSGGSATATKAPTAPAETEAPEAPATTAISAQPTAPASGDDEEPIDDDEEECPADEEETDVVEAPATTAVSPQPTAVADDDEECPADDEDDEEPIEDDEEECPADEDDEEPIADDEEECPADEEEEDDYELPTGAQSGAASQPTAAAANNGGSKPSTVYVTVEPATVTVTAGGAGVKTVTVTAQASACL